LSKKRQTKPKGIAFKKRTDKHCPYDMEIHYPDAPGDSTPLQWKKLLKNQLHARLLSGTSPKPKSEDILMLHLFVL